jgi:outer membrane protein
MSMLTKLGQMVPVVMFAAVSMAALGSAAAWAQTVGVVDNSKVLADVAEIKKAQEGMNVKFKPKQTELETLQKEIETIQQQLQRDAGKLTASAEGDLTLRGQMKQRQFERLRDDLQAMVTEEREGILTKAQDHLRTAIAEVAKTKNLDVVLEKNATLFMKETVDITKDVVAAYDKAFPVK